jgi:Fe2+ transport system protein FeoA
MAEKNENTISLLKVKAGKKVRLARVHADKAVNSRLAAMGLLPETEFTVINNSHPRPFVISVKESKIMLGRDIAQKIMVKQ